jgi:hypothetical protein
LTPIQANSSKLSPKFADLGPERGFQHLCRSEAQILLVPGRHNFFTPGAGAMSEQPLIHRARHKPTAFRLWSDFVGLTTAWVDPF